MFKTLSEDDFKTISKQLTQDVLKKAGGGRISSDIYISNEDNNFNDPAFILIPMSYVGENLHLRTGDKASKPVNMLRRTGTLNSAVSSLFIANIKELKRTYKDTDKVVYAGDNVHAHTQEDNTDLITLIWFEEESVLLEFDVDTAAEDQGEIDVYVFAYNPDSQQALDRFIANTKRKNLQSNYLENASDVLNVALEVAQKQGIPTEEIFELMSVYDHSTPLVSAIQGYAMNTPNKRELIEILAGNGYFPGLHGINKKCDSFSINWSLQENDLMVTVDTDKVHKSFHINTHTGVVVLDGVKLERPNSFDLYPSHFLTRYILAVKNLTGDIMGKIEYNIPKAEAIKSEQNEL